MTRDAGRPDAVLRDELLAMRDDDLRVRAALAADGALFDGYHPAMEAVHRRNAERLREIVRRRGWPGRALVGDDGAEAAWLVAQHAIGEPAFQRACLAALQAAAAVGEVPAWQPAYLLDRVRTFEGRPQRYGTQFEIGDDGRPAPLPIEDPGGVDERRRAVGLEPLAERLARVEPEPPVDAATRARRRAAYEAWLRRAGWRA